MTVAPSPSDPLAGAAPTPAPPRPSASVVVLRDGAGGLEVLLQRRSERAGVLGGMYVFPGGKLDAADSASDWRGRLDQAPEDLHTRLAEPETDAPTAVGLHVAALRETFEEAGILLAEPDPEGQAVTTPDGVSSVRASLQAGLDWPQALAQAGLRWHTRGLMPWTRWITPLRPAVGSHRFDTRFFLARLPQGQQACHDDHEATDSVWLSPRAALERYWAREIGLVPPQLMGLAQLARHPDVAGAWAEALRRPPPRVLPETFDVEGVRHMCYPGDEQHPVRERALPGPSRLRLLHGRFEPLNGFPGWFE